jgi:gas vesicle protein GvpL/GvpF
MLYVYAITEAPAPSVGALEGVGAAAVQATEHGPLAAVHSATERAPEGTHEALWAHERVVEAVMAQRATLPIRFGTVLGDDAELRALLEHEAARFTALLDSVRGCVELSVRATGPAVHERLGELARASTARNTKAGIAAAYLVAAGDVESFAATVRTLQDEHPALDLSCTGPWPPYSFVGGG